MDIMHEIMLGNTVVAVGHHHGFEIGPDTMLFESEKSILSQLSPRKKSEWLASRELLLRVAKLPKGVECLYDNFGKPHLKGIDKDISISHSERWCSVIVSDISCGVDIQVYRETVQRISNRFLSSIELSEIEITKSIICTFTGVLKNVSIKHTVKESWSSEHTFSSLPLIVLNVQRSARLDTKTY